MKKWSKVINYLIMAFMIVSGISLVQAQSTCEQYGVISVANGEYKLQNSVWGATTAQCIQSNGATGFTVTTSLHNQSSVAAYPSIYKGCHWADCTTNSGMPVQVSTLSSAPVSFNVSTTRPSGTYNVAAECWLSPTTDSSNGYSGGAEIMIVLDYHGSMYPAGSQVGTFNGHSVYYASIGWNFVTYVLTGRSSYSWNMLDFINDAASRGYVNKAWYLHSMEAGFELMVGGQGLVCNSFSFSVSKGSSTVTPTRTSTGITRTATRTATTVSRTATRTATQVNATATRTSTSVSRTATPAPTTTSGGTLCTPSGSISIPFTKDGSGEFCWETTSLGSYINSWNLDILEINGINYKNIWVSSSSIPKVNNKYVIHYKASVSWGHLEIK